MLSALDLLDGSSAEPGGEQTVEYSGCAASLDMAQFGYPKFKTSAVVVLLEVFGKPFGVVAGAFRNHHDGVTFTARIRRL